MQHGSTRIMAAKDVGGHDCLLPGNLTRPGCSPAMVLAVNSLQLLDQAGGRYSTVTDLARFLGWSTSQPRSTAM